MKINILTINGFFGQRLYPWESLDVNKIKSWFINKGFEVNVIDMQDIVNSKINIENEVVFYTSSQVPDTKSFIDDVLVFLSNKNTLIPSYNLFRSHDNKGFQELLKNNLSISGIPTKYYHTISNINVNELSFPIVIKKVNGASGLGVWLLKNLNDFILIKEKFNKKNNHFNEVKIKIKGWLNSKIRKRDSWNIIKLYLEYLKRQNQERVILQDFIEELEYDFKILIFFDKYYILQRFIRKDDFRASGSGKFEWIKSVNFELLEYCKDIFTKLNTPFASLDVCLKNEKFYLIEFQAPHMGPLTLLNSDGYFSFENRGKWAFINQKSDLEETYCYSLYNYLKINNEENIIHNL